MNTPYCYVLLLFTLFLFNCKTKKINKTNTPIVNETVSFNGLYQSNKIKDYWVYLRFYEDNTVLEVSSINYNINEIKDWFHRGAKDIQKGKYTIKSDKIEFKVSSSVGTVVYKGTIKNNALTLNIHSLINEHKSIKTFQFNPFSK